MQVKTKSPRTIPPVILNIVIIQVIFVIIIVAVIINEVTKDTALDDRNDQPQISMNDTLLNEANLPDNYIQDISRSLTETIELNNSNLNLANSKAIIRDNSLTVKSFDQYQFNALSFIVDIPELQQSYQVYYKYPAVKDPTMPYFNNPRAVLCLDENTEKVYPDFDCHSSYPSDTRQKIIVDYSHFLSFDSYTINIDDETPLQINITPNSNIDDATSESYITQTKSAIESLGVSPETFKYRVIKE